MAQCQPKPKPLKPLKSPESDHKDESKDHEEHQETPLFTESTVKEMASSLGFEEEFVRMALVQSLGDVTLAAEILFQISEKTQGEFHKMERRHKRKMKRNQSESDVVWY